MPPQPPPVTSDTPVVTQLPSSALPGKDRILGAAGGVLAAGGGFDFNSSRLGQELQKHYQSQIDEANLHHRNAANYAGALATGINPQTGQPLTDTERQQYQNWYTSEMAAFEKTAGVNKDTKGRLAKVRGVLDHIIGRGQGGGPPAPPQQGAAASQAAQAGGPPTPPQSATMSPEQMAMSYPSQQVQDAQANRNLDLASQRRIKEEQEKPQSFKKLQGQALGKDVSATFPGIGTPSGDAIDPTQRYDVFTVGNQFYASPSGATAAQLKPIRAWGKDKQGFYSVELDPNTNQEMPNTRNYGIQPPPQYLPYVREGQHFWTDEQGNIHQLTYTATSGREVPATGTPTSTDGSPPPKKATARSAVPKAPAPTPTAPKAGNDKIIGQTKPPMAAAVQKAYDSYSGAQERYDIMQQALPKAQGGDQQAMLNLLANHIGMTMGLQKGSRITQAIYSEAEQSAPWLQRVQARFDKDGYLSGVVLTPQQMQQMIALAKERLEADRQAWQREVDAAKTGFGMQDSGDTTKPQARTALPRKPKAPPRTADEFLESIGMQDAIMPRTNLPTAPNAPANYDPQQSLRKAKSLLK